jgi:protein-tyrosine phosphatase
MTAAIFVCHANVCRSPMALAVSSALVRRQRFGWLHTLGSWKLDSAGIRATPGEPIDARARAALVDRGYVPGRKRSRLFVERDFARFDVVLAMDASILEELEQRCTPEQRDKIRLFLDFAGDSTYREVPDPYFGDRQGFEHVLDLCELGSRALVQAFAGRAAMHRRPG